MGMPAISRANIVVIGIGSGWTFSDTVTGWYDVRGYTSGALYAIGSAGAVSAKGAYDQNGTGSGVIEDAAGVEVPMVHTSLKWTEIPPRMFFVPFIQFTLPSAPSAGMFALFFKG